MQPFIGRIGGKSRLANRIVAMIPTHKTYVEPFIGGGSVFLRKPPSEKEYINDLDKDISDLWKDIKKFGSKIPGFKFSGSKKQFNSFKTQKKMKASAERLFRNLYLSRYSYGSNRVVYAHRAAPKNIKKNAVKYQERLKDVTITRKDWKKLLKHDSKDTFWYLDPPYETGSTDKWGYKPFTATELLPVLKKIKGSFILSFEYSAANAKIFKPFKVKKVSTTYNIAPGEVQKKVELLVYNF